MGAPQDFDSPDNVDNTMDDDTPLTETAPVLDSPTAEEPLIYAIPPHIAARFDRNRGNSRRKTSATSSRRNSLSSVQSHTSSRSHRRGSTPGCQSNYIAQHLRRASIIESRKARLADRAAHAEQVRLRAALVKATPRGSSSASLERALAAQLAKEKYLARVAAVCAEEVARAKRIAEEVKERKQAEEVRVRLEMEEKHAAVEKRRLEYGRNLQARRARRADSVEKKLAIVEELGDVDEELVVDEPKVTAALDPESAITRIQRAWRLSRRRAKTTFEDTTAFVAEVNTISTTTAMLMHIGLQDTVDPNAALNTRTFLSAYLLTSHPVAVLNNRNGAQEQDLLAKATDLLQQFEATLDRLAPWNNYSPTATALETLSQAYSAYTSAFAAWRLQDSSVLIEGMVASFVELDAIWQTVKNDTRGEVANDYREGIRDNQVMLLSRIRKLAGPDRADFLIKRAIRESRKSRASKDKRRPVGEVRPRGLEPGPSTGQDVAVRDITELSGHDTANTVDSVSRPHVDPLESLRQLMRKIFTLMPDNRVLTHELAIDKDYRLAESSAHTALADELARSMCASMKAGFEAGHSAQWTIAAAENVRDRLLRTLKPGTSLHTVISDALDLAQIEQQCRAGMFSYDGFFVFMAGILPKVCAPFRDREIAKLCEFLQISVPEVGSADAALDGMIEKLFRLLRAVDMLSLDYTNFMLMNAAPTLIREASGYEQRAFAQDLSSGTITLAGTRAWLAHSLAVLESSEPDLRRVVLSTTASRGSTIADRSVVLTIYAHALVGTALNHGTITENDVPETLALDMERMSDLRARMLRIVVIGAVLLTAKNLLRRDARTQWKSEASRLWNLIAAEGEVLAAASNPNEGRILHDITPKALAILETAHNLPPSTRLQLSGTLSRFLFQAANARLTDPMLKVLHQRLRTHVLARVSAGTAAERVRAASSASESLTAFGLGEMVGQVGQVVAVLERVKLVDWEAHGIWYEGLFQEMGIR